MYTSRPARFSAAYGLMPGAGSVPAPWKYSGTISARPPKLMTSAISTPIRPMFFSTESWFMCAIPQAGCTTGESAVLVRAAIVFQTFQAMMNMPESTSVPPSRRTA